MTLYEAIDHCMDVALNCKNKSCQTDHLQLAGWLKELAYLRSMPRHAHWINKDGKFACSNCGHRTDSYGVCFDRYCPNCGAKMDEVIKDESD